MVIDKFGRSRAFHSCRLKQQTTSPLTYGYVLTTAGDLDIQNKRICNINSLPLDDKEAVPKKYVDEKFSNILALVKQQMFTLGIVLENLLKETKTLNERLSEVENRLSITSKTVVTEEKLHNSANKGITLPVVAESSANESKLELLNLLKTNQNE